LLDDDIFTGANRVFLLSYFDNSNIFTLLHSVLYSTFTTFSPATAKSTMAAEISTEEAQKAISEEANDDDFKDAVEEEEADDAEGCFQVTAEELSIIRAELACEFPDDYNYMSDAYILSVASKPYSKDPTVRRPLEVRGRSSLTVSWMFGSLFLCIFRHNIITIRQVIILLNRKPGILLIESFHFPVV
jgi:hypothetical protein